MSPEAILMALLGTIVLIASYVTWRIRDLPRLRKEKNNDSPDQQ